MVFSSLRHDRARPGHPRLKSIFKKQDADAGGIEREGDASRLLPGMTT